MIYFLNIIFIISNWDPCLTVIYVLAVDGAVLCSVDGQCMFVVWF